jgi:hypothetical protein
VDSLLHAYRTLPRIQPPEESVNKSEVLSDLQCRSGVANHKHTGMAGRPSGVKFSAGVPWPP